MARFLGPPLLRCIMVQTLFCPGCREPHEAGALWPCFPDDAWAWFTCNGLRYSFPEERGRLGGPEYAQIDIRSLDQVAGCPSCGQEAKAGVISGTADDQVAAYVCYRCGEVGRFAVRVSARRPDPKPTSKPTVVRRRWQRYTPQHRKRRWWHRK